MPVPEIHPTAVAAATKLAEVADPYTPKVVKDATTYAVAAVDPYVPNIAKSAATYAINTTTTIAEATANHAAAAAKTASDSVTATRDYAAGVAKSATDTVSATREYAVNQAAAAAKYGSDTVTATREYAAEKVAQAQENVTKIVNGATTTITSYTPSPVVNLVTSTIEGAKALRADPVGSVKASVEGVKAYVPSFVIHAGEKTYEIVSNTVEATKDQVSKTTGFVVTKVNGTVQAITDIPQIHALLEQLSKLAERIPVVNRIAAPKTSDNGAAAAENVAAAEKSE